MDARPAPPRPVRRVLLLAAVVTVALLAGSAAHADDPDALRAQADSLGTANARLSDAEAQAVQDLLSLESRLARARERADTLVSRLDSIRDAQTVSRRRLDGARRAQLTAERLLERRLRALYVEGEPDALSVLLGADSLDDALDTIDGLRRLARQDDAILAQLGDARRTLAEANRALAARRRDVSALARDAQAAEQALERARTERAGYLTSLRREQRLNAAEIDRLSTLALEAEQRAAEINRAAEQPAPVAPAPAPPAAGGEPAAPAEPASPPPAASPAPSPPPPGDAPPGGRTMVVEVTAYAIHGTTATGVQTRHGIIATDPSVIPLGTRIYVPGYGEGVAADTGGAIHGNIIDIWLPTEAEAIQWGRRTVTIVVYD